MPVNSALSACRWLLAPPLVSPRSELQRDRQPLAQAPGPLRAEGLCRGGEEPIGEAEASEQERDSKEEIGGHMDFG